MRKLTLFSLIPLLLACVQPVSALDVPIAGHRARFGDLPKKRTNLVISYDRAIDVMNLDPTVTGATLEIAGSESGSSFRLDLPANTWQGPLPGRRFRVTSPGNPKVKVLLVSGRLLRIDIQGSNAHPLGAPQGTVAVALTVGDTRFCTLFGGTIAKDDGTRFVARRAPAPAACAPGGPTNSAPIAHPNVYALAENEITLTELQSGITVGNVLTDDGPAAGSDVDSDPDGDAIVVHEVSNASLTVTGTPIAVDTVAGGGGWQFTFAGGAFVLESTGEFHAAAAPAFPFPTSAGEDFVFTFDYTVRDSVGNVSAPAHVTFSIVGLDP